jgi:transcriptional regulator with XRE-family HTH domain
VPKQNGVGPWLQERCQEGRLSLRQAAAKTGLCHTAIESIIKGASPSPQTIRKLAQAFSRGENERLALEDHLLMLAGYRTQRANMKELSQPVARRLDLVAPFNDRHLKLMADFAKFLTEIGKERQLGERP